LVSHLDFAGLSPSVMSMDATANSELDDELREQATALYRRVLAEAGEPIKDNLHEALSFWRSISMS
jgi:hypothetical protein